MRNQSPQPGRQAPTPPAPELAKADALRLLYRGFQIRRTTVAEAGYLAAAQGLHKLLEARGLLRLRLPSCGRCGLIHCLGRVHRLRQVLGTGLELGLRRTCRRGLVAETPGSGTGRHHQAVGTVSPVFGALSDGRRWWGLRCV